MDQEGDSEWALRCLHDRAPFEKLLREAPALWDRGRDAGGLPLRIEPVDLGSVRVDVERGVERAARLVGIRARKHGRLRGRRCGEKGGQGERRRDDHYRLIPSR